jgi:predicted Zn-dependent protease with MMP-like domain
MDERVDDETFEDWVFEAFDALPESFRARLGRVAITIEDRATPDQLERLGVHGLYGLYTGAPMDRIGADWAPPARITIFREPLMRDFRTREALHAKVVDTVHHEVAHHFGISDARLHELARERGTGTGHG